MADRNRFFRIALLALAGSYLLIAARELIEVIQLFQNHEAGGFKIAALIAVLAFVVQTYGAIVLATAFGPTIDPRRLGIGATIVGSAFAVDFVSTVVFLFPAFADPSRADFRGEYVWTTVGTGLGTASVAVIASRLRQSRRGPDLAPALQAGLVLGALAGGAKATAYFYEWFHFTAQGYGPELSVGTLISALTEIVIVLLLLALAFGMGRPLARRERCLTAAATGIATAAFCGAVGRTLVAIAFGHRGTTLDDLNNWLAVGSGLLASVTYAAVALGARSAAWFAAATRRAAARFPLARRNLDFWVAALVAGGAYLVLAGKNVLESAHRLGVHGVSFGFGAADVISVLAALVGAVGWFIVATAFDLEIDWWRLRLGAAVVSCAFIGSYVAWLLEVLDFPGDTGDFHGYLVWSAIGAFLLAIGALVVLSGLGESKRGPARGLRLQIGLGTAAASASALAVAAFELSAFRHSEPFYSGEAKVGSLVAAIAQIGVALAVIFFAAEARSPLPRRERVLATTAAGGSLATLCLAAGVSLVAVAYSTHYGLAWVATDAWLIAAFPFVFGIAIAFVALGARAAARDAPT